MIKKIKTKNEVKLESKEGEEICFSIPPRDAEGILYSDELTISISSPNGGATATYRSIDDLIEVLRSLYEN